MVFNILVKKISFFFLKRFMNSNRSNRLLRHWLSDSSQFPNIFSSKPSSGKKRERDLFPAAAFGLDLFAPLRVPRLYRRRPARLPRVLCSLPGARDASPCLLYTTTTRTLLSASHTRRRAPRRPGRSTTRVTQHRNNVPAGVIVCKTIKMKINRFRLRPPRLRPARRRRP